jgi:Raf kinase inhibitor-like YbhB/YbcL family protein
MLVTSPAFSSGDFIPAKYTCDGKDVNPELHIHDVPGDTQSIALIVDDPSSPSGNWLHWSVWNIPPTGRVIKENSVPQGAREGETDFSEIGYGGPCPGVGEHEYRFIAFALDTFLDIGHGATRDMIERAMEGHVIAEATLEGRYQRQKIRAMLHAAA